MSENSEQELSKIEQIDKKTRSKKNDSESKRQKRLRSDVLSGKGVPIWRTLDLSGYLTTTVLAPLFYHAGSDTLVFPRLKMPVNPANILSDFSIMGIPKYDITDEVIVNLGNLAKAKNLESLSSEQKKEFERMILEEVVAKQTEGPGQEWKKNKIQNLLSAAVVLHNSKNYIAGTFKESARTGVEFKSGDFKHSLNNLSYAVSMLKASEQIIKNLAANEELVYMAIGNDDFLKSVSGSGNLALPWQVNLAMHGEVYWRWKRGAATMDSFAHTGKRVRLKMLELVFKALGVSHNPLLYMELFQSFENWRTRYPEVQRVSDIGNLSAYMLESMKTLLMEAHMNTLGACANGEEAVFDAMATKIVLTRCAELIDTQSKDLSYNQPIPFTFQNYVELVPYTISYDDDIHKDAYINAIALDFQLLGPEWTEGSIAAPLAFLFPCPFTNAVTIVGSPILAVPPRRPPTVTIKNTKGSKIPGLADMYGSPKEGIYTFDLADFCVEAPFYNGAENKFYPFQKGKVGQSGAIAPVDKVDYDVSGLLYIDEISLPVEIITRDRPMSSSLFEFKVNINMTSGFQNWLRDVFSDIDINLQEGDLGIGYKWAWKGKLMDYVGKVPNVPVGTNLGSLISKFVKTEMTDQKDLEKSINDLIQNKWG